MSRTNPVILDAPAGIHLDEDDDAFEASTPRAAHRAVRVSVHEDLVAVEADWRAFQETADGTVFQTCEWLSAWQRHVGVRTGAKPAVVIGRDAAGAMLFLLPLAVETRGRLRYLTWLGSDLCDYNAPLLAPAFARSTAAARFALLWRDIVAELRARPGLRFDLVSLSKMPDQVGGQPNPFMQLRAARNPSGAYVMHLTGNWDAVYAAKRAPSTQRRDRVRHRKLSEIGEVRLVTPADAGETARTLDILVAQKTRQFAAMGVPNIFANPGWAAFFHSLATDPATRGIVHVSRLDVGKMPAAVNLGLVHRGCYSYVLTAYDDNGALAKHSPGAVHLQELMRHASESGCTAFDFTIGDEPYKRDWCDVELTLRDHMSAASWRGALAVVPMRAAHRLKRWIKHTPAAWNAATALRSALGSLRR